MEHERLDRVSLELARAIAGELASRPEWVELARGNVARWASDVGGSARVRPALERWRALLDRPVEEICRAMTDPGEAGQDLRQNSPFAGALPARRVWEIKRSVPRGAGSGLVLTSEQIISNAGCAEEGGAHAERGGTRKPSAAEPQHPPAKKALRNAKMSAGSRVPLLS